MAPTFNARFSDGRTAAVHPVQVSLDPGLVVARDADGNVVAQWSAIDVRLGDPPDHGGPVRVHRDNDAARITFDDRAVLESLEALYPNLEDRPAQDGFGWRTILGWSAAAMASMTVLFVFLVPLMAGQIAAVIPEGWERRVGLEASRQITKILAIMEKAEAADMACTNQQANAALGALAEKLEAAAPGPAKVRVTILRSSMVNAFALPGGEVLVLGGLLDFAEHPNEVAGVLAHEIGHVIRRHPTKVTLERAGTSFLIGLLLGDVFGGSVAAGVGSVLVDSAYTRDAEREADDDGLAMMERSGLDPVPMAAFLERLAETHGEKDSLIPAILSTHPPSDDRAARIRALPRSGGEAMSAEAWRNLVSACGVKWRRQGKNEEK